MKEKLAGLHFITEDSEWLTLRITLFVNLQELPIHQHLTSLNEFLQQLTRFKWLSTFFA